MNARTQPRPRTNPLVIVVLLALAAAACWVVLPALADAMPAAQVYTAPAVEQATRSLPIVDAPVIYHDHATTRHGADAETVRSCLSNPRNVKQIWEKRNSTRNHLLCILPDGRIGDQVVQLDDNGFWHEITSFIRQESSLDDVMRVLAREARLVWMAK